MASNGTQVVVLGGLSLVGAQANKTALIYVLDPSGYSLFVISCGQLPILKRRVH